MGKTYRCRNNSLYEKRTRGGRHLSTKPFDSDELDSTGRKKRKSTIDRFVYDNMLM